MKCNKELMLYVIFHNSVLFRDFFVPTMWGEKYYQTRYYQYPMALAEDAVILGGRSTGKSLDLEFQEVQDCINDYNQESLITAFRSLHIKARFERILSHFYNVPYFKAFIKRISRQHPIWELHLKNGHTLYGISVGDDPQCVNIQGKHPTKRKGEEFSFYPQAAYIKFQEAADPRGTVDRFVGVCFSPNTLVRTLSGSKEIKNIGVGESVITHKGNIEQVRKVFKRKYTGRALSIKARGHFLPIECTPEHLFLAIQPVICNRCSYKSKTSQVTIGCLPGDRRRCNSTKGNTNIHCKHKHYEQYKPKWTKADDLKIGDYLLFPTNLPTEDKRKINLLSYKKGNYNYKGFFEIRIDKNFMYFCGWYLAEGYVNDGRVGLVLGKHELEKAKELSMLSEKCFGTKGIIDIRDHAVEIRTSNTYLCRLFEKTFGLGAKNKTIPSWIMKLPVSKTKYLVKGYLEGDGCVRVRKPNIKTHHYGGCIEKSITSISRNLLEQVQILLAKQNILSSIRKRADECNREIMGRECHINTVYDLHITNGKTFTKWEKFPNYLFCRVKEIEEGNYNGNVYNLEVNRDNSYCVGLFAVHNCDGRMETPFRRLDTKISRFENFRFHTTRRFDPNFNQTTKEDRIDAFGGEDSDDFKQQIDSLWGTPCWGAWDIAAITANMVQDKKNPKFMPVVITISAKDYQGKIPEEFLYSLPTVEFGTEVYVVMDAGYSQPSCVLIFANLGKGWELLARIMLTDKMIADDQSEFVDYIADFYKATTIAPDCTSAEGRNVAHALMNPKNEQYITKNYSDRIIEIYFNMNSVVGYDFDEKKKEAIEKKEENKTFSATILRKMFAKKDFVLPYDTEILADFGRESWSKDEKSGKTKLRTPQNVHIPEAFRCFSLAWWKKNVEGTITKYEEENIGFALPEYLDPVPFLR